MKNGDVRKKLIESTITVIAEKGLDKTTTKAISIDSNLNEVYIYRNFESKEEMIKCAFEVLDRELLQVILDSTPILEEDLPIQERCNRVVSSIWAFLLQDSKRCKSYIRYYYSPYFHDFSAKTHSELYAEAIEKFVPVFKEGVIVRLFLHYILDAMLATAIKVFDGSMPEGDKTEEYLCEVIYSSIQSRLK